METLTLNYLYISDGVLNTIFKNFTNLTKLDFGYSSAIEMKTIFELPKKITSLVQITTPTNNIFTFAHSDASIAVYRRLQNYEISVKYRKTNYESPIKNNYRCTFNDIGNRPLPIFVNKNISLHVTRPLRLMNLYQDSELIDPTSKQQLGTVQITSAKKIVIKLKYPNEIETQSFINQKILIGSMSITRSINGNWEIGLGKTDCFEIGIGICVALSEAKI